MKVCIAEKPSVAREIAKVIGANGRKDGYLEGNGYAVTWTFGHFCELKSPEDYDIAWKKWSLTSLPMLPQKFETKLKSDKGVKKQFSVLKKLFKKAKLVINCGDAGQEGELIQRWVINQAGYKGPVQRLWISSLTTEAIRAGFRSLKDASQFDRLYYAGSSRAIGDWVLGMNATRLYTLKYGGYKQVLSIGRVQTPTLAMVVKRYYEILRFKPEPFWELQTVYREATFNYVKGRFTKKEEGQAILKKVQGQPFTIISSEMKNGKEYPPRLFDLTSLQVHCNKKFGFTADQTLKLVQQLYEKKLVTYPRVDTTYLPTDQHAKIAGILQQLKAYSQFTQPLLGKPIPKSKRIFDDQKITDHHAIIPTGIEAALQGNLWKVYDAITKTFLANFYPLCIVANTVVIGEAAKERFKATGKIILDPGWRVLFPKPPKQKVADAEKQRQGDKAQEKILPEFSPGENGPHDPKLVEKMTQAPKPYTEATLLRAMETAGKQVDDEQLRQLMKENGIGRPSTRAGIIETLFRRKYTRRQKKWIHPTEVGIQLIDIIQNELLKSAEMTGIWERKLRQIESGEFKAKQFVQEMLDMVSGLTQAVKAEQSTLKIAASESSFSNASGFTKSNAKTGRGGSAKKSAKSRTKTPKMSRSGASKRNIDFAAIPCPKCNSGTMLKGKSAYGCSAYKTGCDFRLPFKFKEKKISENQYRRLLAKGSTVKLKGFLVDGQKISGKLLLNSCSQIEFVPEQVEQSSSRAVQKPTTKHKTSNRKTKKIQPCPKCGKGQILKGKTAYGCSDWKQGCKFRFSFEKVRKLAAGRKLTEDLVLGILKSDS